MGIKLDSEADGVVGMDLVTAGGFLWSITDNGLAKATPIDDYPLQNRYGQGVINVRLPKGASEVVAATLLTKGAGLIVTTSGGVTKRLGLSDTTIGGRSVRPQPALTLAAKARVTGIVLPAANGATDKKASPATTPAAESRRARPKAAESNGAQATAQPLIATSEEPPAVAAPVPAAGKRARASAAAKPPATKTAEPPAQMALPIDGTVDGPKAAPPAAKSPAAKQPAPKKATPPAPVVKEGKKTTRTKKS
jgi:hypothetical protein